MRYIKYTEKQFIDAVKASKSIRSLLRALNLKEAGGNYRQAKLRIEKLKLDISHFETTQKRQGWSKGKKFPDRKQGYPLDKILVENSTYASSHYLKIRLLKEGVFKHICQVCKLDMWLGRPISLELEHKNGNNRDNRLENLNLICPNCHAQTLTYRGKNKKHA